MNGIMNKPLSILAVLLILAAAVPFTGASGTKPDATAATQGGFGYEDYGDALKTFVDARGMVNYRGLKARAGRLNAYVNRLARVRAQDYAKWSDEEKVAFWVNAYNGLTLKAIVDHYPIKASWSGSLRFPRNSIRQIPGVWDELQFTVMGKRMTLEDIEHGVLRKDFNEPRIHFALVCAAKGCPLLRNEPYVGARLDEQLADQTRRFLADGEKFKIDRREGKVLVSSIFKWFGGDFVRTYGAQEKFRGVDAEQAAVLNFVSKYVARDDARHLVTGKYKIGYLDYDWSLNEQ